VVLDDFLKRGGFEIFFKELGTDMAGNERLLE
jgi:hypothetical protein